jgi:hypothetical protein
MALATETFLTGMGLAAPRPVERILVLWFAALLVVITYILARTLWSGDARALRIVLEGYLIGDVIYLIGQYLFVQAVGGAWTGSSLFGVGITIFLAAVRVVYLLGERRSRSAA